MRSGSFFITLLLGSTLSVLPAQQVDTTGVPDSLDVAEFSWVTRLVPLAQDTPRAYHLHLPWDEWAHSDLTATAGNPFVPADLLVGAAYLDGSLGQPVLSAVIPSSVIDENGHYPSLSDNGPELGLHSGSDIPVFLIAPMQDRSRRNQTYFFWDQGDYRYQDVQVGGAVQLDESRNILTAGQGRSHPGRYTLAGPNRSRFDGNVLQNYLLDYRRRVWPSLDFNYTLLHQREQVGLPMLEGGNLTADRRRNRTWAHGFRLEKALASWNIQLFGASMVSDLQTTTDGVEENNLGRRSLSLWAGSEITYRLTSNWRLRGAWQGKQRHITDHTLGYKPLGQSHGRLGTRWDRPSWSLYGGLAIIDGRLTPEAWLALGSAHYNLTLRTEASSFLDYPHLSRCITQDSTSWLPGPVYLRRSILTLQANGSQGHLSTQLGQLSTGDGRTAATGGLLLDWIPWIDVLQLQGSITAVSSPDTHLFPTRINALAGLTFTLPLKRTRARPFVSANAAFISNEFAWWNDPRYADTTPFLNPAAGTLTTALWTSAEAGLKVNNFELRFRIYNAFGATIQNSPVYLPQPELPNDPLKHFSLSWRFLPQKK
ncbi:MAG: hypothetical protein ACETWG_12400 [Candidatus Neomarinimicrobiota bacterium]